MIEPFVKGSGFLQLPLGEKENENVLFIYLKKKNSLRIFSSNEKYFTKNSAVYISSQFSISNLHKLEYCRSIFLEHIWSASNLAT